MMNQLEQDAVRAIVKDFMSKDLLFTALDISNEAKKAMPHLRHREVRDVVREMFANSMQSTGWARSDISVTLADGTPQTAHLYYPLSASWDLDSQYDAQKRAQISTKPSAAQTAAAQALVAAVVDAVTDPLTVTAAVAQGVADAATDTAQAVATSIVNSAHDLWKGMFQSKPSLFPLK
jgi:hypothetical protein